MTVYFVWALLLINARFFIKAFINDHRNRKQQKKLDLYHRAKLIGRRRLDHESL